MGDTEVVGESVSFRQVRKVTLPGGGNTKCKDLRSRLLRVIKKDEVSQWGWVQMSQVCL